MISIDLRLRGNLKEGCDVTVTVAPEGQSPNLEQIGRLPANQSLAEQLHQHWSENYRKLTAGYSPWEGRITPKRVSHNLEQQDLAACLQSAQSLTAGFQEWLQADSFQNLDRQLRELLNLDDDIKLLVRNESIAIQKLPWHKWDLIERYPRSEVFFSPLIISQPLSKVQLFRSQLRVLAILGDDTGIDIQADRQFLLELSHTSIEFLVKPQRLEITDRLWEQSWDILFFAGHSETKTDKGKLHLNADESLSLEELRNGLKKAIGLGLQLAIFNSCDGLGLARTLSDLQIPMTLVMRESVPDEVAQAFLKYFLTALTNGEPFHRALRQGRERLESFEDRYPCASWMPVVVQHPQAMPIVLKRRLVKRLPWVALALLGGLSIFGLAVWRWGIPVITSQLHRQGWAYYEREQFDRAKDTWQWVLRFDPNYRPTWLMLGFLHEKVGDVKTARTMYQEAAMRGQPVAYRKLAELAIWGDKDYDYAAVVAQQGLSLLSDEEDPARYNLLVYLAFARLGQGQEVEAIELLESAIALNPNPAKAYCVYGEVLTAREEQGRTKTAKAYWQKCASKALSEELDEERWRSRALKLLQ